MHPEASLYDVINILAPDGTLTKEYTYDSFGVAASSGSFSNEVQFTGAIADGGGVYYMNARYYNANTGRFLTQDSYKGNAYEPWTQHLYTYVGNNPVNMVDPTGHRATEFSNMEEEGGIRRESVVPKYLAPVFDGVDEDLARHAYIELAINGGYFTSDIEKQLPGDVSSIAELAYKVHTRLGMSLYQADQYLQKQLEAQRQALLYLLAFSASMKSIENYNAAGGPFSSVAEGAFKPFRFFEGVGKSLSGYGAKSNSYITKRGWTWDSAQDVVGNPYTIRKAVNKATGNSATVFYNQAGDYVVRDNITGELVQVSKFGDVNWIPDSSIINPYRP